MATITGRTNGAPSRVTKRPRPGNRRRASARATGIASRQDTVADSAACQTVKRSAAQSAGDRPRAPPARSATAASGAITKAATIAAAKAPGPRGGPGSVIG